MYNLKYTPTTLGVQSWRESISGGMRTRKDEYHCCRVYRRYTRPGGYLIITDSYWKQLWRCPREFVGVSNREHCSKCTDHRCHLQTFTSCLRFVSKLYEFEMLRVRCYHDPGKCSQGKCLTVLDGWMLRSLFLLAKSLEGVLIWFLCLGLESGIQLFLFACPQI
jgi:hypothetical protein